MDVSGAWPDTTWSMGVSTCGQQNGKVRLVQFGIVSTEDADVRRLEEGRNVCRGGHALGKHRVQQNLGVGG